MILQKKMSAQGAGLCKLGGGGVCQKHGWATEGRKLTVNQIFAAEVTLELSLERQGDGLERAMEKILRRRRNEASAPSELRREKRDEGDSLCSVVARVGQSEKAWIAR